MMRSLLRGLIPLLLLGTLAVSPAQAEEAASGAAGGEGGPSFVFPAFLAIIGTILVLFILCKPNRKG